MHWHHRCLFCFQLLLLLLLPCIPSWATFSLRSFVTTSPCRPCMSPTKSFHLSLVSLIWYPVVLRVCILLRGDKTRQLWVGVTTDRESHPNKCISRSPAVARMADRIAPVVKLTLTLTLMQGPREWDGVRRRLGARHGGWTGHNLAKTGTSPLNGPIMKQKGHIEPFSAL